MADTLRTGSAGSQGESLCDVIQIKGIGCGDLKAWATRRFPGAKSLVLVSRY
jgi:hypothetical protein